jgi:hypothetical protein
VLSRNTNNPELIRYYKKYCKILSDVIKSSKKHHYNKLIANSKNKVKTTWGIIRSVTNINSSKNAIPLINIDGKLCNNTQTTANTFNNYFITPLNQMQSNKLTNVSNSLNYLYEVFKHPFPNINMTPVTNKEIKDTIK